jgi:hypothetical protein
MTHQFRTKSHDLTGLFSEVNLMSTFINRLQTQAEFDPSRYDVNDYLGDGFEFFVELFLKVMNPSPHIGVYNYVPIPPHEDKGADGVGENMSGNKCVVQVKFRGNNAHLLTANEDHLSNLMLAGMHMGISFDQENPKNFRHFVFTTAKSLHFYTDEHMFEGKVKCFGLDEFRQMVDNNQHFWNRCREIVRELDPQLQQLEV